MKKLLMMTAAAGLAASASFAADLPSRKAPPIAPPPPPPMWTGFYVGLNAGGTWGNNNLNVYSYPLFVNNAQFGNPAILDSAVLSGAAWFPGGNSGGFIGGGQIGYNLQFGGSFVAGLEADIQGVAGGSRTFNSVNAVPVNGANFPVSTFVNAQQHLDYVGTVRGRLGWLFTPTLMVYGTGGLAYGGVSANFGVLQTHFNNGGQLTSGAATGAVADTRVGWTAGGGVEWMFMPNWSAKVEYLYYDLGDVRTSPSALFSAFPDGRVRYGVAPEMRTSFRGNIVRAGLNYHFNWGAAPVIASY
ncbi:MAG: outer-membrane immunogenic protein precursor [Methylocystis sp.]|nr:MAG: outer-membrane immunogenic protein precursor [Methylocystis sp.]